MASEDPDWDGIYFRIRTSPVGADFPSSKFLRTPVSTLRWVLQQLDDQDKAQANISSVSTARLTALVLQVAHGFSGSKGPAPATKAQDFLPFPDWEPHANEKKDGPDQETKSILTELGKTRRIPMHVFVALMTLPEQSR